MADDPTQWTKIDFEKWKHLGEPTSNKVQPTNATPTNLPAGTALITTVAKKQQKTDDDRLQGWRL